MHEIMVVDDEAIITTQLEERLKIMGYEVVGCASSGEEAVDMARRLRPDLILMDIVMPGKLDGIEASRTIKAELDIPIIFLTAYTDEKFINRAKNVEPFGYIVKPFQEKEIKATIEVALYKKELERKLQASEEQFRAIVETAPSILQICDAEGNVIYASPNCEKIMGYPQEELKCRVTEWVHEEDMPKAKELLERTFREGVGGRDFEYKAVKKNGEVWYASSSWVPLKDEEGRFKGVVFQTIDITERKQAEEEVRRLNEELEQKVEERTKELANERDYTCHLIESSPDFQITLDKDGRIMYVNEAFEHLVGKSREDIIGCSIHEYIAKERTEKLIAEIFEKEKVRNIELMVDIPGKGTLIWNLSGTVFTTVEGEKGVYLTGRDLTELRAKETQLIHAGRLSSLGEMATGISHEINQPLFVISMAAESILRDIEKKRVDISELPRDLEEIISNVKRINRIITHMRAFARKPEEMRAVKPEEVLNNAFILLGEQFRLHNVLVSREIEKNLPFIDVDANQLEQVFINILTNARQTLDEREEEAKKKAERFEKRLVCRISREREKENEREWVVYEFADNAYGVPEELKMRVFEPFFTTKEPGEGTGLGLSIAYGIVTRSLRGKIWVEDNEAGGASFKVAVPVANKELTTRLHKIDTDDRKKQKTTRK